MKFVRVVVAAVAILGFGGVGFAGDNGGKTLKPTVVKKDKKKNKKVAKKSQRATKKPSGDFSGTTCTNGGHKRTLEITYGDESTKVPCEVHYKKVTEEPGHDQVLWSAQNDSQFCTDKASEFVGKLQGWGWDCQ